MTFRRTFVLAVASLTVCIQSSEAQVPAGQGTPPRDNVREAPATAAIRGHVTAAGTNQPLHRVRITLNGSLPNPPTAVTDIHGAFELAPVPAGTFTIAATRAGYLTAQYGQRRPREAGRTVRVENGQILEGIDIVLSRGAVLAGRITDDLGEPSPATRVEAVELRYVRGRRVAVPARIATTNDMGDYRLAGLEPGTYQVRASSRETWEGDDGQATYAYALTYFPGVTAADRPQGVTVTTGQQLPGLDFRMVPGRTAKVTGIVENASGAPQAGQVVYLSEIGRTIGGALLYSGPGGTTRTDAAGAFEFTKIPPGEYLVIAGGPNDRASQTVIVQVGDARHVVLAARKPTAASGSVVTDEGAPPPFPAARLNILPVATDATNVLPEWGGASDATPKADWTFRIPNMDGRYLFRVTGLPDDWMLERVVLGSRDITDTPLDVRLGGADVERLQIVLSRTGARLTGDVLDRAGSAAPDSTVIVFAENTALWGVGSRFVRAVRPDRNGRFTVAGLPAATYRVIARGFVTDGQWEDAEFLNSIFRAATRVELANGASGAVRLTVQEVAQ